MIQMLVLTIALKVWCLKLLGRGSSRFHCGKAHVTLAFIETRVCESYMRTELDIKRTSVGSHWSVMYTFVKRLRVDSDNKYTRPDFDPFHSWKTTRVPAASTDA